MEIHRASIQIPLINQMMTSGVLLRWLVNSGDLVEIGQPLYELEIDKGTFEVESFDSGRVTLSGIEGVRYEIGTEIGYVEFTEEERLEFERLVVSLTYNMRQAIDAQRGIRSRCQWLKEEFTKFIEAKLDQGDREMD